MSSACIAFVGLALCLASGRPKAPDALEAYFRQFPQPGLARELCVRVQADQVARQRLTDFQAKHSVLGTPAAGALEAKLAAEYGALVEAVRAGDSQNLVWLKAAVAKHGWPGRSLVGVMSAQNAWLLVQHADADRPFQEECLAKMAALPKGEVEPQHLAYLTDRVLIGAGKKQKYGTQGAFRDGKVVAAPIEDEAAVDERRKAIGLGPLAKYLKSLEAMYRPAKH